ncbi:amidase [Pseudonocardia acaciae]|uniref:amidase n=1 Tax=Pseudonocardia acaciae TaxID=551276 RepID=UPI00048A8778|nr:amidase [Pseudonocardia acaciae]
MPIPPPTPAQLAALNDHYGLGLSESELAEYAPFVEGGLGDWATVERRYAEIAPAPPERAWTRPTEAENPLGAWYVTTSITETDSGPLAGRTVAIKDNTAVAGVPMMNGSSTLEGFVPSRDATVVSRLLAAGATVTGKAVCEDLCFSGGSFTSRPGPVRNPWDPTRNAGGSSSGSAALVASGAVDLSTGGDQGGSVRIPSSFSGTVGHKPTHGLVPYTGAFPIEQTVDHIGPITRTVADAALMLQVLAGVDGLDPRQPTTLPEVDYLAELQRPVDGLRIGILTEGFGTAEADPAVDEAVRAAIEVLRSAGLAAEPVSVPWHRDAQAVWDVVITEGAAFQMIDGNGYGMNHQGLYDPELIAYYGRQRRERAAEMSKTLKFVAMTGRHAFEQGRGRYYAMARNLVLEVRKAYDAALADYDVLAMPTLPYTAKELLGLDAPVADYLPRALSMLANTSPFDVTGHPAISVPTELVNGLPAGLMLVGKHFDDATVLRIAHAYELAVGGFPAPPATVGASAAT